MAEGGYTSCFSGSEITYDFYCELCVEEGNHLEAHGYCTSCKEYLCEQCYHGHKKTRWSRHHVLVDKFNMPKDTPLPSDRVCKLISTTCNSHPEEVVKFYCRYHDVFGCSTCFATEHKSCSDVENILDKSETILNSQGYKSFITKMTSMMKKSEDMLKLSRDNKTLIRRRCSDALCVVRQVKEEAVLILEEIENSFVELAEKLCSESEDKMENLTKKFSAMLAMIESINSEVESLVSSKQLCQLYIKMKESEKVVTRLKKNLRKAEIKNVVKSFTFSPNSELKNHLKTPDILGKFFYQEESASKLLRRSNDDPSQTRAKKVCEINARTPDQPFNCTTAGSAVLSETRLIITDITNYLVKLVDTNSNTIISELRVSYHHLNVVALGQTQAAVTCDKKILLLKVGETLSVERELALSWNTLGIAYSQDKLFVTYMYETHLDIIDLHGKLIRTIEYDNGGNKLFKRPWYLCVSRDGNSVYVTDMFCCVMEGNSVYEADPSCRSVTRLTCEGVVMSVFTDDELETPQQICTDHCGNVYVCDFHRNIFMITADCKKVKMILTQADGLGVNSVSHCQDTDRLFVGMYDNDTIQVYQLS